VLLTILLLVTEAVALAIGMLIFLTLLGLGVTLLLLPAAGGYQLLLAPAVGLALVTLGFQWVTPFIPAPWVLVLLGVVIGPSTIWVGWRNRTLLVDRWRDLAGATLVALAFFIALLQIVFQRGFFTMGEFPSDNVFIYVQAAQYLRDHPMPSPLQGPTLHNPGSFYLVSTGPSFPNSVGQVDAALSVLTGWPVYTIHEPVTAMALALTIGPVWFLVRSALGGSWLTALIAGALIVTNQMSYWTIGLGFQQESLALPLFVSGLAVAAHALRTESLAAGALAGIIGGALPGLYLPLAALLALCVLGCVISHVILRPRAQWTVLIRPIGAAAVAGAVSAAAALYILLAGGGLAIWLASVGSRVAAGAVSRFPAIPYVTGTVPLAHVWELSPQPLGNLQAATFPFLFAASAIVILLLVLGPVRAVLERRAPEAALLVAGLAFVGYEGLVARYPYGYVKSIDYLVPLTSAFIAYGAMGVRPLVRSLVGSQALGRAAGALGALALALVLLAAALASRDMVKLWLGFEPSFTRAHLSLSSLASTVPAGASVLVDRPTDSYGGLVEVAAIAYFLPDRPLRVFVGDVRLGTFADQNVRPPACRFDYVLRDQPPEGDFGLAGPVPNSALNVYRRVGPPCP
jgi:hypothetical protein